MSNKGRARGGLGRFLGVPGGVTYATAVQRGENGVEFLRDEAMAELARAVAAIDARLDAMGAAPAEPARRKVMELANGVATIAGLYGREVLGQVAQALFNLIDELGREERWDAEAVRLHQRALAVAHARGGAHFGEAAQMLDGLARVRRRALRQTV